MTPQTLEQRFTDLEQDAVAEADHEFAADHGAAAGWEPQVTAEYVRLIARVHYAFHPDPARARLRAGRLAEQRHQYFDLDADSVCRVRPVKTGVR